MSRGLATNDARLGLAAVIVCAGLACGIGIRRDLSGTPPGQVGFDDLCDLQRYFDDIAAERGAPPRVVFSLDLQKRNKDKPSGGKAAFAFESPFQLGHVRRILEQNWKDLPEGVPRTKRIEIEVRWAEKAGVRRVTTEEDAVLMLDRKARDLPYHVCLSELLYGEPLYKQRRAMLGLPPPAAPDAGINDSGMQAEAAVD